METFALYSFVTEYEAWRKIVCREYMVVALYLAQLLLIGNGTRANVMSVSAPQARMQRSTGHQLKSVPRDCAGSSVVAALETLASVNIWQLA